MIKIYFDLIKKGLKTINDVPEKWKSAVQTLMNSGLKGATLNDNKKPNAGHLAKK